MNQDALCDTLKTKPLSSLTSEEMRAARELAYSILRADYYRDVRAIVLDVKSEVEAGAIADREALTDYVHQSVDGTARVIYTHSAKEALILSDNADAMIDDFGPDGIVQDDSIQWSAMAYHALERDVMETLDSEGIRPSYWDDKDSEGD